VTAGAHQQAAREAAAAATRAANRSGTVQWAALRARVPTRDCLERFSQREGDRFYWEQPDRGRAFSAWGAAHVIEVSGPERFRKAAAATRKCFASVHLAGDAGPLRSGPLLVGGFAFSPGPSESPVWRGFPPGRFALPELLFSRADGDVWCTVVRRVAPGADADAAASALCALLASGGPDPRTRDARAGAPVTGPAAEHPLGREALPVQPDAEYLARVEAALRAIADGDLEKIVLARSLDLRRDRPIEIAALLRELRRRYPRCTSFAVGRADRALVGATPEHLVSLSHGRVETAAVAGSAPRGRDPEEDAQLGRALCESKKEQAEHAVVVRALREALTGPCEQLEIPEAPQLLRLGEIQHLETRITGTLRNGTSILELVERMHPTPAVGGAPRGAALRWLAAHEDLDRGWYASPVGFVDAEGGGEFCVALRAAVIGGSEARLFAGAGIVDGSRPEAELRETRLKLHTLLAPLRELTP